MPKISNLLLLGLVVAGGIYVFCRYDMGGGVSLPFPSGADSSEDASQADEQDPDQPPVAQGRKTIRVAAVHLGPFDQHKLSKPHVVGCIAQVIRQFDVVAIQDVRARNQSLLVEFVERVNSEGRHYDFAAPPGVGREPVEQYSAFLFDEATVQIDRRAVYSVEDEADRLCNKPLVASFIARAAKSEEAFTFTLVNVHTDRTQVSAEVDLLDDVFRAVRDDGRMEDDVILLGYVGADIQHLGQLAQVPGITWAISDEPTTTRGTRLVDNILFDRRATTEFSGRTGVLDLMRQFNLTLREAVEISDHLPIWAEFSIYEGGQAGHVAGGAGVTTR